VQPKLVSFCAAKPSLGDSLIADELVASLFGKGTTAAAGIAS
jgi:hypothetical protein